MPSNRSKLFLFLKETVWFIPCSSRSPGAWTYNKRGQSIEIDITSVRNLACYFGLL